MNYKAILFDLDDTLHDPLQPFSNAFRQLFPQIAQEYPIEEAYNRHRSYSDSMWEDYIAKKIELQELRLQRILLTMKDYGLDISRDKAAEFQAQYETGQESISLFPEVQDLFQSIVDSTSQLAIITNGPTDHQFAKIKTLHLTTHVPRHKIFISDEVGIAKPNPDLFHHVANKLEVTPESCLYIGDNWENDVVAPIEAGWQSIWFNHRKKTPLTEHKPLAEVDTLSELYQLLKLV